MAWYDEAIFYHIYPLGMLDAPKENDYGQPVHRLRELKNWIGHIKNIGCNAIYIGPLFESVGHGYETTDYKKLDSRLGDNDDLKNFVKDCHDNGIKVIFDGVFNHVGRDFFAFKDLKANREGSRYKDWFLNVNFWGNNEYNDGFSYDNWGGYNLLVKLNQRNPEVKNYIEDVIRFWVKEFDVDGIRLDAADVLDFDFMKMLRWVANDVKPDFWLMGEVIHGDYSRWVNEGTLHSVTNYTLHKALYSGHNDHNYFEVAHTVKRLYEMGGNRPDGLKLYNFSDNHDVERIINKINNRNNFYPVHILSYTLPGVPSIYYGSEFGIEGKKEKFSDASLRPALKYDDYKDAVNTNSYTAFMKRLGEIRKSLKALSYGDYREVSLTNRQYVYTRSCNGECVIIAVNNDENPATVRGNGIPDGVYTGAISGNKITVNGGYFETSIPANYGEIWIDESKASKCDFTDIKVQEQSEPSVEVKEEKEQPVTMSDVKEAQVEVAKTETIDTQATEEPVDNKADAQAEEVQPVAEPACESKTEAKAQEAKQPKAANGKITGAAEKYGLDAKYSSIDPDAIKNRNDYEAMTMEELQVAILEKMYKNGPVNDQMIKTVMDNVYMDSLKNWVKSFN